MERFKKILHRLLYPKWQITYLCVIVSAAALVYFLTDSCPIKALSYPVYVFSAYTLTVLCIRVYGAVKKSKQLAGKIMDRFPILRRYVTDAEFKTHVSLSSSLGLNLLYALMKFGFGIFYGSVWFGTLAVYYFLLAVMRFILIRFVDKNGFEGKRLLQWKRYRMCGIVLMLMTVVLTGVVILVIHKNEGFYYAGYLIYIMAMYAFYSISAAVVNVVKYRRYKSPVMSAAKVLQLVTALVSILALETAMLAQFGGDDTEAFRSVMTGCTGGGVCAGIFGIALYMICHSLKMQRRENNDTYSCS